MTKRVQALRTRPRAVGIALALAMVLLPAVVAAPSARAQTFTDLYNFTGGADGADPWAGVVLDAADNIYGTTMFGGSSGYGTVFKMDSSGNETVLHSFAGTDGAEPWAGVIRDANGNIYGTTMWGGCCKDGTVFKLDPSGKQTVLHSFTGGTTDGCNPTMGLVQDKLGNLYGATQACGSSSWGTIFKLDQKGNETVLYSFTGGTDGENPNYGSLFMDKNGNLYGVTSGGGLYDEGVVYKLSKSGKETVLHTFAGGETDGCYPYGSVTMDHAGNLYGTTVECGTYGGGVVWKVSERGKETLLHSLYCPDGCAPSAGVVLGTDGNLYGDNETGGSSNDGTIFKLTAKGKITVLHTFSGSDGKSPVGGVVLDKKGNLYGAATFGGSYDYGTVFKLTP
jgi:uncharacterized repeat protein (TIGR03803 family)